MSPPPCSIMGQAISLHMAVAFVLYLQLEPALGLLGKLHACTLIKTYQNNYDLISENRHAKWATFFNFV